MSLEINFVKKQEHLEVKLSGSYEFPDAINKFLNVLLNSCQSVFDKVLIDYRQLEGDIPATEHFLYTMATKEHHQEPICREGKPMQVAYVGNSPHIEDENLAGETIKKKNQPFTLAQTINEARSWLGI